MRYSVRAADGREGKWHLQDDDGVLCGTPSLGRTPQYTSDREALQKAGRVCRICLHKEAQ
jgi:hypothetical protein